MVSGTECHKCYNHRSVKNVILTRVSDMLYLPECQKRYTYRSVRNVILTRVSDMLY